jgi:carboxyl-terminal processing protease
MSKIFGGKSQGRTLMAGMFFLTVSVLFIPSVLAGQEKASSEELARLIYAGRFDQARKLLPLQAAGVVNQPTDVLGAGLSKYTQLAGQQATVRAETYEKNVKTAKEYLAKALNPPTATTTSASKKASIDKKKEKLPTSKAATTQPACLSQPLGAKGKAEPDEEMAEELSVTDKKVVKGDIENALTAARKARYYATDQKKFGQLDWVRQIADKAKVEAAGYMKKHEWLKAGNIYAELATIYEDDKTYDKLTRDCAMRVRFEATYKPKSEWAEQVKNIKIDVIPEMCYHIATYYVETPDFSKMINTGLQSISTLTEIPKLTEVFPGLKDPKKTQKFDQEMKKLIEQINAEKSKKTMTTREFWRGFVKMAYINDSTIDLPQEVIIKEFVDSALGELDPFTNVIWPYELDDFEKHTTGRFSGVGIQLSMENNKLKVITPIPGTPAYHAGVVPGDLIVSINGESTNGITIDQAVRKITGPKGTKVVLGIQHPWEDAPRETPLIRDTIIIQTIKGYRMDKKNNWQYLIDPVASKIAYIRLTSFTDTTTSELEDALKEITKEGAKGLILDMRFNPGGTLKAAVEVVDLFIPKGVIVSTRGRNVEPWERGAAPGGNFNEIPMVVLVNNFSASAAEIVSGALKDHHRAWIIGERSFGKGSVQNVLPLCNEACRFKITTAHYYLPSGRCLHRKPDSKDWGVEPDLKIELTPNELRDIIDLERDAEIVTQVNGVKVSSLSTTKNSSKTPAVKAPASENASDEETEKPGAARKYPPGDIQLQAAVAVIQARLALNVPWENMTTTRPAPAPGIMVKTPK